MPHPAHVLDAQEQSTLVTAAAAAPSVLNTQPWSFTAGPAGIEVHADPGRAPAATASAARDVHLSCGAAVFNARVALARLGRGARTDVLPDAGDPLLVARVTVADEPPDPELEALHHCVGRRRTNRYPFRPQAVPAGLMLLLYDAAAWEGATLRALDEEPEYQRVLTLIRKATWTEDERAREDRAALLGAGSGPPVLPVENLGPVPRGLSDGPAVRDLADGLDLPGRGTAAFEQHPTLAILETDDDDPVSWVAAGQALERVLLEATGRGVAASFANQPLEDAELRDDVSSSAAHFGHPQMVLRLGYPLTVPPAAPRRPETDVLRGVRP
ncbi:Acg family FMN-binding oxidoreductase [Streptomyces halstedii]|uniref:Acg family FMN-binding oxidoreductase n=1 Tax=Streptomyces halstedii TaxID=1944 RepID=UPI0037D8A825